MNRTIYIYHCKFVNNVFISSFRKDEDENKKKLDKYRPFFLFNVWLGLEDKPLYIEKT